MISALSATTAAYLRAAFLAAALLALSGCATAPPRNSQSICQVFDEYPSWYRDARAAQKRWGTPVNVLMAFVRRESDFREKDRPDRPHFLFIPLPRKSSAYGYAQAQDPTTSSPTTRSTTFALLKRLRKTPDRRPRPNRSLQ